MIKYPVSAQISTSCLLFFQLDQDLNPIHTLQGADISFLLFSLWISLPSFYCLTRVCWRSCPIWDAPQWYHLPCSFVPCGCSVTKLCLTLGNPVDCSMDARLPCLLLYPGLCANSSMMPSNHLILCHPLLLLPSIFPSIKNFPMNGKVPPLHHTLLIRDSNMF